MPSKSTPPGRGSASSTIYTTSTSKDNTMTNTATTATTAKNLTAAKTALTKARNADAALKTAAQDAAEALAAISRKVATGDKTVNAADIAEAKDAHEFSKLGASAAAPALQAAEAALKQAAILHATATVEERLAGAGDLSGDQLSVEFMAALEGVWADFSKRFAERDALIAGAAKTLKDGGVVASRNITGEGVELALLPGGYASTLVPVLTLDGQPVYTDTAATRAQSIAGEFESFTRWGRWS